MEINNFSVRSERMRRWREMKKQYYKGPCIHRTEEAGPCIHRTEEAGPCIHWTEEAGSCISFKDKPLGWFGHYTLACPDNEDYPISFPGKEYYPVSFPGREQRRKRSHKTLQIVL